MVLSACTLSCIAGGQGSCSVAAAVSPNFASHDISGRSLFLWRVTGYPSTLKLWKERTGVAVGALFWVGADGNRARLGLERGFHLCCNGLTSLSLAAAWVA